MRRRSIRVCCRGAWARVTIDQFRHLALQTGQGHRASTSILANQNVQICIEVRTIVYTIGLSTWIRSSRSTRLPGEEPCLNTPCCHAAYNTLKGSRMIASRGVRGCFAFLPFLNTTLAMEIPNERRACTRPAPRRGARGRCSTRTLSAAPPAATGPCSQARKVSDWPQKMPVGPCIPVGIQR
jgi:hypothetical protein